MTNEEILKLVKEYFQEGGLRDDGSCSEYYGDPDAFVKFAERIFEEGRDDGKWEGYYEGRNIGFSDGCDYVRGY